MFCVLIGIFVCVCALYIGPIRRNCLCQYKESLTTAPPAVPKYAGNNSVYQLCLFLVHE
jgi:hypothetical protein